MYIPPSFRVDDLPTLHAFLERYSFATLISNVDGAPFATHLPLLVDRTQGELGTLLGHFAAPNPHAAVIGGEQTSLAVFQGPHAYISPTYYSGNSPAVPTWNYAAVHVYGRLQPAPSQQWTRDLLDRLVAFYESGAEQPWKDDLDDDLRNKLLGGIVAFSLPIERLEGKFKLGQNRSLEDQQCMFAALQKRGADGMAEFVRKHSTVVE